jgi:hypothetical protein
LVRDIAGLMGVRSLPRVFCPGAAQGCELISDDPDLEQIRTLVVLASSTLIKCCRQMRTKTHVVELIKETADRSRVQFPDLPTRRPTPFLGRALASIRLTC